MWKFARYLAYQPLIWGLFIFGGGLLHSLVAGAALALVIPLAIEFAVIRYEKRNA
jgi:hypothetical protein